MRVSKEREEGEARVTTRYGTEEECQGRKKKESSSSRDGGESACSPGVQRAERAHPATTKSNVLPFKSAAVVVNVRAPSLSASACEQANNTDFVQRGDQGSSRKQQQSRRSESRVLSWASTARNGGLGDAQKKRGQAGRLTG